MKDSVTVCASEREGGRDSYSLAEKREPGSAHQVVQIDTHSYNKPTALEGHGHTLS